MEERSRFMRPKDIAEELECSPAYAYKIIKSLNQELEKKGFMTFPGRVIRDYFEERTYYKKKGD